MFCGHSGPRTFRSPTYVRSGDFFNNAVCSLQSCDEFLSFFPSCQSILKPGSGENSSVVSDQARMKPVRISPKMDTWLAFWFSVMV